MIPLLRSMAEDSRETLADALDSLADLHNARSRGLAQASNIPARASAEETGVDIFDDYADAVEKGAYAGSELQNTPYRVMANILRPEDQRIETDLEDRDPSSDDSSLPVPYDKPILPVPMKTYGQTTQQGGDNNMAELQDYDTLVDFLDHTSDVVNAAQADLISDEEAIDNVREMYEEQVQNVDLDELRNGYEELEESYLDLGTAVEDLIIEGRGTLGDLETALERHEGIMNDKVNNAEAHARYLGNEVDRIKDAKDRAQSTVYRVNDRLGL